MRSFMADAYYIRILGLPSTQLFDGNWREGAAGGRAG